MIKKELGIDRTASSNFVNEPYILDYGSGAPMMRSGVYGILEDPKGIGITNSIKLKNNNKVILFLGEDDDTYFVQNKFTVKEFIEFCKLFFDFFENALDIKNKEQYTIPLKCNPSQQYISETNKYKIRLKDRDGDSKFYLFIMEEQQPSIDNKFIEFSSSSTGWAENLNEILKETVEIIYKEIHLWAT